MNPPGSQKQSESDVSRSVFLRSRSVSHSVDLIIFIPKLKSENERKSEDTK